MKNLTEKDIIQIMREEWNLKLSKLAEAAKINFDAKVDGKKKNLISPGLKVRNKVKTRKKIKKDAQHESKLKESDSKGYLYTVVSVTPTGVVLQTPEGELFTVDKKELEQDYEVD